jgi:type 1 glutamine amidotransferase
MRRLVLVAIVFLTTACPTLAAEKISVLIIDGQNNHNWRVTTPRLQAILESTGLFKVDVATAPPADTAGFKPPFANYQVVVSNYNGAAWPADTQQAFTDFVNGGGGFVSIHAANNAFGEWKEYNKMLGIAGWGGRDEKAGPYLRFRDGVFVRDSQPGKAGSHGAYHPFVVEMRNSDHPIAVGLPPRWMHAGDELYDRLRGPAENITVLATAFADPAKGGSGEHEPILMAIDYGKGRVVHTTLGHDLNSMKCAGFAFITQRGTEWAATGKVSQTKLPDDFPTADKVSIQE